MKYLNKNVLLSALLLTGTVAFTSCSKDDDFGGEDTTLTGEAVKTQFAISVPYGSSNSAQTRMSGTTVQYDGSNFRGMKNIRLIPLTATGADGSTFTQIIPLADIAVSGLSGDNTVGNYKLYSDVEIPVGTKNFLFYGEGGTTSETTAATYGQLNSTLISSPSSITGTGDVTFTLEDITDEYSTSVDEAKALLALLNNVAGVEGWSSTTDTDLAKYYATFTSESVLYCGSGTAVKNMLENLYYTLETYKTSTSHTAYATLAAAIQSAITGYPTDGAYLSASGTALSWTTVATGKGLDKFPTSYGLPEGTAVLSCSGGKFSYASTALKNIINPANVTYPSSLYYFVNTTLKATTATDFASWPGTATAWTNYGWSGWSDEVLATTRTIALKDNIQYSVAQLVTTVVCGAANLEDNAKSVANASANNYIVVPEDGFPVTGVLIGGQPNTVGWDFYSTSTSFDKTIYDSSVTDVVAKYETTASTTNYTLVLDNLTSAATQPNVNVAIELTNNSGTAFYGLDGIIAKGAKFYLIGQLSLTGKTAPTGVDVLRVFTQDYTTTANFTITSLQKAYATIPDLRASQMQLGLSVDLTWQAGLSFTVEL